MPTQMPWFGEVLACSGVSSRPHTELETCRTQQQLSLSYIQCVYKVPILLLETRGEHLLTRTVIYI